jgi:hypothetical protein
MARGDGFNGQSHFFDASEIALLDGVDRGDPAWRKIDISSAGIDNFQSPFLSLCFDEPDPILIRDQASEIISFQNDHRMAGQVPDAGDRNVARIHKQLPVQMGGQLKKLEAGVRNRLFFDYQIDFFFCQSAFEIMAVHG